MYFIVENADAEDDGTAWKFDPSGLGWQQVGARTVALLRDELRVVGADSEILVDDRIAEEIGQLWPECALAQRPANIIGPQPALERRSPMVQLLGVQTAHLAKHLVEPEGGGRVIPLRDPLAMGVYSRSLLDANYRVTAPICKIAENRFTIVSEPIRKLLLERAPKLEFGAVPFEDEPFPDASAKVPFESQLETSCFEPPKRSSGNRVSTK